MASGDLHRTLKRKASSELSRFGSPIASTLDTLSNIATSGSDEPSTAGEQSGSSTNNFACSPSPQGELGIAERVASFLRRSTPRVDESGEYKAYHDESQKLMLELLIAYQDKSDELNNVKKSAYHLKDEKKEAAMQMLESLAEPRRISTNGLHDMLESGNSNGEANETLLRIERVMNDIHSSTLDNPYALVLVDGDGYIFSEDLIRQGHKGGEIAAERLKNEMHSYFHKNNFQGQRGWRVVVLIFASVDGLAHKMEKFGRVLESNSLPQFMAGVNQSSALINVVDVGQKCKEVTDFKIRAFFELFASDVNLRCRHVVLGCSHDKGYLRMLSEYKHKASHKDSITLLETKTPAEGFQDLPFRKLHLHDLLVSSTVLNSPPARLGAATQNLLQQPPNLPQQSRAARLNGMTVYPDGTINNTPSASSQSHLYPRHVAINSSNQRVDLALPTATTHTANKAATKLKTYLKACTNTGHAKPCNDWHLSGQCPYGNSCSMDHQVNLTRQQLEELARMARQQPCQTGSTCRDNNCVSGHLCPFDGKEGCFFGDNFRLEQFHGTDTAVVEMWDPTGNAVPVTH